MQIRFDGKVVLITGGNAGIGLSCAELFASLGAKVAICGTNPTTIAQAVTRLEAFGVQAYGQPCDIANAAALHGFADAVEATLGPIDVWVSNAGIFPQYSLIDTPEAVWDTLMDTNVKAVYLGAQVAYQHMKDRGGAMLLASSFASVMPTVGSGAYAASKSAVSSMVKTLAAELAPYNIRVNGYIPGVMKTNMNTKLIETNGDAMSSVIAMQSFGESMDVAWAVAFLASDYARYITGTNLEISGGKFGVQNPAKAWANKEVREATAG